MQKSIIKQREKKIILSGNSIVEFLPLTRVQEPDGKYYVGREETSTYLHLKNKYAEIIRLCDGKRNLREVIELYIAYNGIKRERRKKALLGETLLLIEQLVGYGFVRYIDNIKLMTKRGSDSKVSRRKYKFLSIFFSTPAMAFYILIFLIGIANTINNPAKYIPRTRDVFWHHLLTISLITQLAVSLALIFKHELAHLLSALAFGIKGEIYLSRRMLYLVAETRLKDIYKLPRKERITIYLAGIASDAIVYGFCLILLHLDDVGVFDFSSLFALFLKQVILVSFISILWQFRFYMKTDIYAIFEDVSGCDELLALAKGKIKYRIYKLLSFFLSKFRSKVSHYKKLFGNELYIEAKHILSWYALFVLAGILISITQFIVYDVPITFIAVKGGCLKIILGFHNHLSSLIIEGNVILLLQLIYWGLFIYVFVKDLFFVNKKKWDENIIRWMKEISSTKEVWE